MPLRQKVTSMTSTDPQRVNRDLSLLCPTFVAKLEKSLAAAKVAGYDLAVFEGYRAPERQLLLYLKGRAMPGKVVTNAPPWTSAHQACLAVDLAIFRKNTWSWDFGRAIHRFFHAEGLETLDFEIAHIQFTGGLGGKLVAEIARDHGKEKAWEAAIAAYEKKKRG